LLVSTLALASAAGLDWDTVQDWSEQLATALQPRSIAAASVVVPATGAVSTANSIARASRRCRCGRNTWRPSHRYSVPHALGGEPLARAASCPATPLRSKCARFGSAEARQTRDL